MLPADFFRNAGLHVVEGFAPEAWCAEVCEELRTHASELGTVLGAGGKFGVDEKVRKVRNVEVPSARREELVERLEAIRPDLAAHYGVELETVQEPQFLHYSTGDFYAAHRDRSPKARTNTVSSPRRVSAVLFLNRVTAEPEEGAFGGGALTFYGLFDDPRLAERGFPVAIQPGLLVTFPAETVHEVQPVLHGDRFTAASWFV